MPSEHIPSNPSDTPGWPVRTKEDALRAIAALPVHDCDDARNQDCLRVAKRLASEALVDRLPDETVSPPQVRRFRPMIEGGHIRSMAEIGNPNGVGGWNAEYVLASDYDELTRGELKANEHVHDWVYGGPKFEICYCGERRAAQNGLPQYKGE